MVEEVVSGALKNVSVGVQLDAETYIYLHGNNFLCFAIHDKFHSGVSACTERGWDKIQVYCMTDRTVEDVGIHILS